MKAGKRVDFDGEIPHRGHHVQAVSRLQTGIGVGGESSSRELLYPDAKPAGAGVGAYRVTPPDVLAVDLGPNRDVLSRKVLEFGGERGGDIQGDRDRLMGKLIIVTIIVTTQKWDYSRWTIWSNPIFVLFPVLCLSHFCETQSANRRKMCILNREPFT